MVNAGPLIADGAAVRVPAPTVSKVAAGTAAMAWVTVADAGPVGAPVTTVAGCWLILTTTSVAITASTTRTGAPTRISSRRRASRRFCCACNCRARRPAWLVFFALLPC